jgi:hypothetical protein
MATRGRSARAKGNSYELAIKNEHIEMGFGKLFTPRNESMHKKITSIHS